ncbi:hypothetical protein A1O1_08535 [Capronia coronata CBS 617.96]|uniref:Uncharacterized protein n=1 Tax=Capronia coronata CBS 617.96 TaxID=1182541 RepID=W9XTU2_9EURO|nr:uncharacterized protein A1O1_08535 [Capronia coronata CBS 617.96]EXJ80391.1 hypothetical protein A1O1_08535 [Capronia coronata CBS 617.96]
MSQDSFQGALDPHPHPPPRPLPLNLNSVHHDDSLTLPLPAPTRGHQRSRTAIDPAPLFARDQPSSLAKPSTSLPFLCTQSTRSLSPERASVAEAAALASESLSEEPLSKKKAGAVDRLASWFDGSSEPVNIGLIPSPRKEKLDPVNETKTMENFFFASPDSLDTFTRRPKRPSLSGPAASTATTSRFSFFRRSTVAESPTDAMDSDELAQMDVQEALFPHGYPDEFSPAAFKNLQLNAEGTLRRCQQAYVDQAKSLRSTLSAKNVQADELEAAQTRTEHLKLQLQEMAERAADQEKAISELRSQLALQRASLESRQSQQQSIRMVEQDCELDTTSQFKYRRNRASDVSTLGGSEAGSEVSSAVSVFSEAISAAPSQATSVAGDANMAYARVTCSRCHGVSESEAWDVMGTMKLEATALKQRISQLENAQEDALDFLSGLKLS